MAPKVDQKMASSFINHQGSHLDLVHQIHQDYFRPQLVVQIQRHHFTVVTDHSPNFVVVHLDSFVQSEFNVIHNYLEFIKEAQNYSKFKVQVQNYSKLLVQVQSCSQLVVHLTLDY